MPVWRLILVLLLSITLPAYGFASVLRVVDCPAPAHTPAAEQAAAADPCCDDMNGHDSNGHDDACSKLCSLGGGCQSAPLMQPSVGLSGKLASYSSPPAVAYS